MSALTPKLIIEWSPGHVLAYQPGNGSVKLGETVAIATDGLPTSNVLVAISRRTSFVRTTRVPNASYDDVGLILRNQLGNLFPLSGNDLAYDFQLTDDITAEGRLALVAAIPAESLRQLQEECREAGLKIGATVPAALGSVELMNSIGLKDSAVVQVDEQGASIDVVTHGVLRYSRWTSATRDVPAEVRRTFAAAGIEQLPVLAAGGSSLPADHHSSKSTLVGLAQIDLAKPPLNIELGETRALRAAKANAATMRSAAAVLVAGIAIAVFFGFDRYDAIKKTKVAVDSQAVVATKAKQIADKAKSDVAAQTAELAVVNRGFQPAQRFWEVLAIITQKAPIGVWLTGVSMERGKPFVIRGTAMTNGLISAYSQELAGREDRFRNVKLLYSTNTSIENRPVVLFSITGFPTGNLPLVDPPSAKISPPAALSDTSSAVAAAGSKS